VGAYLVRKTASFVCVLFIISALTFLTLQVLPGDPAQLVLGTESSPQALAALRRELGLDKPAPVRFGQWLVDFVQGDFGRSIRYSVPVKDLVVQALPVTLSLAVWAVAVSLGIAVLLGVLSAAYMARWWGQVVRIISQLGMAVPQFWIGILLIQVFGVQLRLLPAGGYSNWQSLILPIATLALPRTAVLTNMVQVGLSDVLKSDYIRTAKSKGLPWRKVLFKHAFVNGAIAVATSASIQLIQLVAGTIVVEQVFGLPGIGQLLLNGVLQRDLPLVQAITVFVAVGVLIINLLMDYLLMFLDPRVRFE
jgi:peptide/nickel transport system permease protein